MTPRIVWIHLVQVCIDCPNWLLLTPIKSVMAQPVPVHLPSIQPDPVSLSSIALLSPHSSGLVHSSQLQPSLAQSLASHRVLPSSKRSSQLWPVRSNPSLSS